MNSLFRFIRMYNSKDEKFFIDDEDFREYARLYIKDQKEAEKFLEELAKKYKMEVVG